MKPFGSLLVMVAAALAIGCHSSRAEHEAHGTTVTTGSELSVGSAHQGHEGHQGHDVAAPAPSGYAPVTIEPARAAAIGMTTATLDERDFVRQLRTTGLVVVDETRTAHVHTKVRGWVDGIQANYLGQRVQAGQVLCGIYSQEVYAAEIEFLSLLGRVGDGAIPAGEFAEQERRARTELVAAARRRLALWDVPRSEIERLETTREPRRTFPLTAPRGGVVVAKQVLDGTFVDATSELYTITDLSHVWLFADVYETDVASIRLGQTARIAVEGLTVPVEAKVAFVPPTIDESTRTLKVRFELDNKARQLRPGAFATVAMEIALDRGLALPESAVIRTGTRSVVFVVHGGQHVEPREAKLGPLVEGFYRVESGLSAGDVVATGAQFLLDSETRLRASGGSGAGHGGH